MLDRDSGQSRHLPCVADEFAEMTALLEQPLGMRLLEEARADLRAGDVRGDGQHRSTCSMSVEETLDQVRVAGTAAASANRKPSGQLGVGRGGKGTRLLVANVHPFDSFGSADRIDDRVEAIADDAVDPLDPSSRRTSINCSASVWRAIT
jgi:hypothetical protein